MIDDPAKSPGPRSLDLTPQEHEVWVAVYMDTLKHERSKDTYQPAYDAAQAARRAVEDYREMSAVPQAQPPKEAANG